MQHEPPITVDNSIDRPAMIRAARDFGMVIGASLGAIGGLIGGTVWSSATKAKPKLPKIAGATAVAAVVGALIGRQTVGKSMEQSMNQSMAEMDLMLAQAQSSEPAIAETSAALADHQQTTRFADRLNADRSEQRSLRAER